MHYSSLNCLHKKFFSAKYFQNSKNYPFKNSENIRQSDCNQKYLQNFAPHHTYYAFELRTLPPFIKSMLFQKLLLSFNLDTKVSFYILFWCLKHTSAFWTYKILVSINSLANAMKVEG